VTQTVIPDADQLGVRVTPRTPLAVVVAALRRHNPRTPLGQLKRAAEQLRLSGNVATPPPADEPEVSREASPGLFDSGVSSGPAVPQDATATEPELVVGEPEEAAPGDDSATAAPAPEPTRKPTRAEVEAWIATLPKRQRPQMSKSGRIPVAVLTAYRAAQRDEVLSSMVPVEGGEPIPAEPPITEVH